MFDWLRMPHNIWWKDDTKAKMNKPISELFTGMSNFKDSICMVTTYVDTLDVWNENMFESDLCWDEGAAEALYYILKMAVSCSSSPP